MADLAVVGIPVECVPSEKRKSNPTLANERRNCLVIPSKEVHLTAKVARKQPDLPRFVVIPASAVAEWKLTGTTPVDVAINGVQVERRTLKYWDAAKWFFNITLKDCKKVGIDTGDTVEMVISLVAD